MEHGQQSVGQRARYMGPNRAFYGIIGNAVLVSLPSRNRDGVWDFHAAGGALRCTAYDLVFLPSPDEISNELPPAQA
jgi:hypothetical protein